MTHRDLTDEQWARLQPLLPPRKPRTGQPNLDQRRIIDGILWILRTGAPWDDLPGRYGKRGTVSSRFYRWRQRGIWERVFADLRAQAERDSELDWTLHFVDSTVVRAHQHAAGAKGGTPRPKRWGAARVAWRPR
jgi:transposase